VERRLAAAAEKAMATEREMMERALAAERDMMARRLAAEREIMELKLAAEREIMARRLDVEREMLRLRTPTASPHDRVHVKMPTAALEVKVMPTAAQEVIVLPVVAQHATPKKGNNNNSSSNHHHHSSQSKSRNAGTATPTATTPRCRAGPSRTPTKVSLALRRCPIAWRPCPSGRAWTQALLPGKTKRLSVSTAVRVDDSAFVSAGVTRLRPEDLVCDKMEVLRLPSKLDVFTPVNIVLRKSVNDAVVALLRFLRIRCNGRTVVMTGTSGIGKSEGVTAAVVRGLLNCGGRCPTTIVIDHRSSNTVMRIQLCVPRSDGPTVITADIVDFEQFSADSLMDPTTVYIVDLAGSSSNRSVPLVAARTVVIAAPGDDVGAILRRKDASGALPLRLYLRPWTLPELLAARPHINVSLSNADVVRRWAVLGGSPRDVFVRSQLEVQDAVSDVRRAIAELADNDVALILAHPTEVILDDIWRSSLVWTYVSTDAGGERPVVGFRSPYIEFEVCRMKRRAVLSVVREHVTGTGGVFKTIAFDILSEGCTVPVAALNGAVDGSVCDA
jgi:hypothetical protein